MAKRTKSFSLASAFQNNPTALRRLPKHHDCLLAASCRTRFS